MLSSNVLRASQPLMRQRAVMTFLRPQASILRTLRVQASPVLRSPVPVRTTTTCLRQSLTTSIEGRARSTHNLPASPSAQEGSCRALASLCRPGCCNYRCWVQLGSQALHRPHTPSTQTRQAALSLAHFIGIIGSAVEGIHGKAPLASL